MSDFFCPTEDQIRQQTLALLPRGRAWQTNEDGVIEISGSGKKSVLWQYWASFANVVWFLTKRLCDLRLEFWCASHNETHDGWMKEYGLPDACDPFPDLCIKVAAIGGTRCEYYTALAARSGWAISCVSGGLCGSLPGRGQAGCFRPGRRLPGVFYILVDLANSPAYGGTISPIPKAGRMKAGRRLGCGPDIGPLICLLSRVVHAEILVHYEVVE